MNGCMREIVKSIVLNKLHMSPFRVYARECDVKVVDVSEATLVLVKESYTTGYCYFVQLWFIL